MASETTTPNVGLQVPAFNQPNWQTPINFDLNLLDLIFGGSVTVPAMTIINLTIGNVGPLLATAFVNESPAGAFPGNTYTLSYTPTLLLAFCYNGSVLRRGVDYTIAGATVTLVFSTNSGESVYALYFR